MKFQENFNSLWRRQLPNSVKSFLYLRVEKLVITGFIKLMNYFIQYTGDNYEEILEFAPGFIRSDGKSLKMYVYVPLEGAVLIHKGDYILKRNDIISIRHDV